MSDAEVVDDWMAAALADDGTLAAKALVDMSAATQQAVAELKWGLTQPRSAGTAKKAAVMLSVSEEDAACAAGRGSPTTPLCWSDGTGTGTSGGAEEASSRRSVKRKVKVVDKGAAKYGTAVGSRRSKKKTMDELRAAEGELVRANLELKQRLKAVKVCLKELRTRNNLLKFSLKHKPEVEVKNPNLVASKAPAKGFSLPDLNLPFQDESSSETLFGMR